MKAYREDIKSDQAKMIAALKERMDARIEYIRNARTKTTAYQEVMRAKFGRRGDRSGAARDS
jgi:hypothetical protein